MTISNRYDKRQNKLILDDGEVGVGKPVIRYNCSSRAYNPSSGISGKNVENFWYKTGCNVIKAKIEELNSKFFEREKEKTVVPPGIFNFLFKKKKRKK